MTTRPRKATRRSGLRIVESPAAPDPAARPGQADLEGRALLACLADLAALLTLAVQALQVDRADREILAALADQADRVDRAVLRFRLRMAGVEVEPEAEAEGSDTAQTGVLDTSGGR